MKIIKTSEYFIDPLNKRIENIESKGSQYDKMGKGFEDLLANLINKEEKNDFELELIKSLNLIFGKEVKECKVIRDNKCKGDILITFIDDSTACISLKNTNASQVSGGEYCVDTVCDYFKNEEFSKHFKKFFINSINNSSICSLLNSIFSSFCFCSNNLFFSSK